MKKGLKGAADGSADAANKSGKVLSKREVKK